MTDKCTVTETPVTETRAYKQGKKIYVQEEDDKSFIQVNLFAPA